MEAHRTKSSACQIPTTTLLGVPIASLAAQDLLPWLEGCVEAKTGGYVCAVDANSLVSARTVPGHGDALLGALAALPDGAPLVVLARLLGDRQMRRIPGPDLFRSVSQLAAKKGWRVYLYGGAPGVPALIAHKFQRQYPGLQVAGLASPPFRALTKSEIESDLAAIRATEPAIVWVALGCPRQERWMAENFQSLPGILLIGVGAAFDFASGRVQRAPRWVRAIGMEWLFRLSREPARLWKRYIIVVPKFLHLAGIEILRKLFRQKGN